MHITEQQRKELLEAAKPLIRWLAENGHPHLVAEVDQDSVALVEGICLEITTEFLKD